MIKKAIILAIIVIGITLRFYNLGEVPYSMDWDEVSLGYNAYSMLLQGTDEYGNTWPLSIRSFNDYKPPAYAYFTIPSIALFGLDQFSIRAPSAFFGSLTIIFVYLLTREFFKNSKNSQLREYAPLTAMFIFAISPWSLQFSRAAFEANIAVFFVVSGMWAILHYLNTQKPKWIYLSALLLAASFYCYHAPRLVVPLLLLGVLIRYRNAFKQQYKHVIIASVIALIFIAPLVIVLFRGTASSRFTSVSVFKPSFEMLRTLEYAREDEVKGKWESIFHNRRMIYALSIVEGYADHFYPSSMFLKGDPVQRHHAPGMGHFYLLEFPFFIIGLIFLLKKKFNFKWLFFYWYFIAPIPAAISTGTPHAIRSILFLPIPQIMIAVGLIVAINWSRQQIQKISKSKALIYFPAILVILSYIANFTYYLNQYYVNLDKEYAREWQYGYKELVETLKPIEDKYDKILVTTAWDQPYIYFLYYKNYDPRVWINNGEFNKGFDKYEFRRVIWAEDRNLKNTLIVGSFGEIPEGESGTLKVITFPDGKLDAFRIYDNPND